MALSEFVSFTITPDGGWTPVTTSPTLTRTESDGEFLKRLEYITGADLHRLNTSQLDELGAVYGLRRQLVPGKPA